MRPYLSALLTFGDSSGNPSRSKGGYEDSTHYIIVTATMDMGEAYRVDAQVQALKSKYFKKLEPERVSFHGNQLLHNLIRYTGNRSIAEKKFKEALDDVVKITQNANTTINAVIMDKQFPRKNYSTTSTVIASWAQASGMIRQTLLKSQPGTVGATILDRYDDSTNRIVAKTMTKFLGAPVSSGESDVLRIMPRPIFVHSTSCNLIQLVDVIAFIAIGNSRAMPSETFVNLHAQLKPYISHTAYITAR